MDYKIPDPKVEPLKCLVLAYKVTKGVSYDDRTWDSVHWARTARSAKALLEICGNVRNADSCLVDIAKRFEDANLNWTLETVVKQAHEWLSKKRGATNGNTYRARFFKALSERERGTEDNPLRKADGSISDSFGSLQDSEKGHQEVDK